MHLQTVVTHVAEFSAIHPHHHYIVVIIEFKSGVQNRCEMYVYLVFVNRCQTSVAIQMKHSRMSRIEL